jgi:hypothetical protein
MGILSGSIFITWKQRTNTKKNYLLEGNTKCITNFKTRGKIRKLIMYILTYYFFYYLFLIMVPNALSLFLYSNLAFLHITLYAENLYYLRLKQNNQYQMKIKLSDELKKLNKNKLSDENIVRYYIINNKDWFIHRRIHLIQNKITN